MSDPLPKVVSRVYFNGATIGSIEILPDGSIQGKLSATAHPILVEMIRQGHLVDLSFHPGIAYPR